MILMVIVFVVTFKKWYELLNIRTEVIDKWGEKVRATIPDEDLPFVGANQARMICEPIKTS